MCGGVATTIGIWMWDTIIKPIANFTWGTAISIGTWFWNLIVDNIEIIKMVINPLDLIKTIFGKATPTSGENTNTQDGGGNVGWNPFSWTLPNLIRTFQNDNGDSERPDSGQHNAPFWFGLNQIPSTNNNGGNDNSTNTINNYNYNVNTPTEGEREWTHKNIDKQIGTLFAELGLG